MTDGPAMVTPADRRLTLAIVDDNPFLRTASGSVHPAAATFHRFAEAVVRVGPFRPARYLVPVRALGPSDPPPRLPPLDARFLAVEPTVPFGGIADYVRRAPRLVASNWPTFRRAISGADLVWIKAPASNAPLAALAAARSKTPRFAYVAGSARDVVASQRRGGVEGVAASLAAALYDGFTAWLERSGPAVRLDADLFTSVVDEREVALTLVTPARARARGDTLTIAWAGRMAGEKGLPDLVDAVALLASRDLPVELLLVGDGPTRPAVEARVAQRRLDGRVRFAGYVGDPGRYFALLRTADVFVLPSGAEGVPKVVVEAMAAGVPVLARPAGATADVVGGGARGRLVREPGPEPLAREIERLLVDDAGRDELRAAALAWVADRTSEAQARRLVAWMRQRFPRLAWPPDPAESDAR